MKKSLSVFAALAPALGGLAAFSVILLRELVGFALPEVLPAYLLLFAVLAALLSFFAFPLLIPVDESDEGGRVVRVSRAFVLFCYCIPITIVFLVGLLSTDASEIGRSGQDPGGSLISALPALPARAAGAVPDYLQLFGPQLLLLLVLVSAFVLSIRRMRLARDYAPAVRMLQFLAIVYAALGYGVLAGLRWLWYHASSGGDGSRVPGDFLFPGMLVLAMAIVGIADLIRLRPRPFPTSFLIASGMLVAAYLLFIAVLLSGTTDTFASMGLVAFAPFLILLHRLMRLDAADRASGLLAYLQAFVLCMFAAFLGAGDAHVYVIWHYLSLPSFFASGWVLVESVAILRSGGGESRRAGPRLYLALALHLFTTLAVTVPEMLAGWFTASSGLDASIFRHLACLGGGIFAAFLFRYPALRPARRSDTGQLLDFDEWRKRWPAAAVLAAALLFSIFSLFIAGRSFHLEHKSTNGVFLGMDRAAGESKLGLGDGPDDTIELEGFDQIDTIRLKVAGDSEYPYARGTNQDDYYLNGVKLPTIDVRPADILRVRAATGEPPLPMFTSSSYSNPADGGSVVFYKPGPREGQKYILSLEFRERRGTTRLVQIEQRIFSPEDPPHNGIRYLEENKLFTPELLEHLSWESGQIVAPGNRIAVRAEPRASAKTLESLSKGMIRGSAAVYTDPQSKEPWLFSAPGWVRSADVLPDDADLPATAYHAMENIDLAIFDLQDLQEINMRTCKQTRGMPFAPRPGTNAWRFLHRKVEVYGSLVNSNDEETIRVSHETDFYVEHLENGGYMYEQSNELASLKNIREANPLLAEIIEAILPYSSVPGENDEDFDDPNYYPLYSKLLVRGSFGSELSCYSPYGHDFGPDEESDEEFYVDPYIAVWFFIDGVELKLDDFEILDDGRASWDGEAEFLEFSYDNAKQFCEDRDRRLANPTELAAALGALAAEERRGKFWIAENGPMAVASVSGNADAPAPSADEADPEAEDGADEGAVTEGAPSLSTNLDIVDRNDRYKVICVP